MTSKSILTKLFHRQLSAVVFIRDYIQLQFDGPVLSLLVYPSVDIENERFKIGDVEYRNKICQLIGEEVVEVTEDGTNLILLFSGKGKILVALKNDMDIPETAVLRDEEGNMQVW
jgi:hypothetical protein